MQHGAGTVSTLTPGTHEPQGGTMGPKEVHGSGSVGQDTSDHWTRPYWKRSCNQNAVLWNESMYLSTILYCDG